MHASLGWGESPVRVLSLKFVYTIRLALRAARILSAVLVPMNGFGFSL